MRGKHEQQLGVFSYISPERRVPQDHPLRSLRTMTDEALQQLKLRFDKLYAKIGRPSIAPEKLCGHSCYKRCTRCEANGC
jgi:transposase